MRLRRATRTQKIMALLMGAAFILLGIWLIPEIIGIVSPATEDTYTELVRDQPAPIFWPIVFAHGAAGFASVWAAGHFIEHRRRVRNRPFDDEESS